MDQIFVSHVEEDADLALGIADGLNAAGYDTWCYERDALPGPSYLLQTARAIESSSAVLLLISPTSLGSNQVTAEVIRAHESGRPFIPVLAGISHVEFAARQPEWREAIGSATSVSVPDRSVQTVLPRIVEGLQSLGIVGLPDRERTTEVAVAPVDAGVPPPAPQPPVGLPPGALRPAAGPRPPLWRRPHGRWAGMLGAVATLVAVAAVVVTVVLVSADREGSPQPAAPAATAEATVIPDPGTDSTSAPDEGTEEPPDTVPTAGLSSTDDEPITTVSGPMKVKSARLSRKSCLPSDPPEDCSTAAGPDRFLTLTLVSARGSDLVINLRFDGEALGSTVEYGGGRQAGALSSSQNTETDTARVVYGLIPASMADKPIVLHWPGNEPLLVPLS